MTNGGDGDGDEGAQLRDASSLHPEDSEAARHMRDTEDINVDASGPGR